MLKIVEEPGPVNPTAKPVEAAARPDHVVLLVRFPPDKRQAALGEIGDIDPKIEIRDERRTLKVRLSDLRDGGDALLVQSGRGRRRARAPADRRHPRRSARWPRCRSPPTPGCSSRGTTRAITRSR